MFRTLQNRVTGGLRVQWSRMVSDTVTNSPLHEENADSDPRARSERCLNKVTLIGRVGKEPERRGTGEPHCLVFPLATNQVFRKVSGEHMAKTDWHRVVVFRPGLRDSVASRVMTGDRLFVEGSISYTKFVDNESKTVNVVSIVADQIMFLSRRKAPDQPSDNEY